jgi:hypothetical protein
MEQTSLPLSISQPVPAFFILGEPIRIGTKIKLWFIRVFTNYFLKALKLN